MVEHFESIVEENPSPTVNPWKMCLKRKVGMQDVLVTITGEKGGLKASFYVNFKELDAAIAQIDPVITENQM